MEEQEATITVEQYTRITTGCILAADGLVHIPDDILSEMIRITTEAQERLQGKVIRKPPVDLSDPEIMAQKKAELTAFLAKDSDRIARTGGKILSKYKASKAIHLGKNAIADHQELLDIYLIYKHAHSNIAPSTLNNDPSDYLEFED